MKRILYALRQGFVAILVLCMTSMAPVSVVAAADTSGGGQTADTTSSTADTPASPTPPSAPTNGPTGADAGTYHYDASSGKWVNQHFTYDPAAKTTAPLVPYEYTYNPSTKLWDTKIWQFNANTNDYDQVAVSVTTPPAGAITHGSPDTAVNGTTDTPATPSPTTTVTPAPTETPALTPSPTAPASHHADGDDSSGTHDSHHDGRDSDSHATGSGTTINTSLGSSATSGDASASHNDVVGNTATGDAQAAGTVINQLQSQSGLASPGVATFTANIQGNVSGDMLIDPATFSKPLTAQSAQLGNLTINNSDGASINNTITLAAQSGNAAADANNTAGDVTSGTASAIAQVVNMINSVVAANQSFVGTINIYGDYTGNILMPADSLNALLGSSGGGTYAGIANGTGASSAAITNNTNLAAASGNVMVTGNGTVGDVASGNALTNVTILNLTGHQVVAANSLLVFVNVLGSWYGLIMDAPAGSTAAALGGGVTVNNALPSNTALASTDTYGITNTINASATSGSATATDNRTVGNVSSGNAMASASIANLLNNNLSLSGWFGILFINVFGTWHGNFGVVKPPVVPPVTSGTALPSGGASGGPIAAPVQAFAFIPKQPNGAGIPGSSQAQASGGGMHSYSYRLVPLTGMRGGGMGGGRSGTEHSFGTGSRTPAALTAASGMLREAGKAAAPATQAAQSSTNYLSIVLFSLGAAGFGIVGVERVRSAIRRSKTVA